MKKSSIELIKVHEKSDSGINEFICLNHDCFMEKKLLQPWFWNLKVNKILIIDDTFLYVKDPIFCDTIEAFYRKKLRNSGKHESWFKTEMQLFEKVLMTAKIWFRTESVFGPISEDFVQKQE